MYLPCCHHFATHFLLVLVYYYNNITPKLQRPEKAHFAIWAYFHAIRGPLLPRILPPEIKVTLFNFSLWRQLSDQDFIQNQFKYRPCQKLKKVQYFYEISAVFAFEPPKYILNPLVNPLDWNNLIVSMLGLQGKRLLP